VHIARQVQSIDASDGRGGRLLNGVTVLLDFGVIQMSSWRVRALGSVDCCGKATAVFLGWV